MSDRVEFTCNGDPVVVDADSGETLLNVLRERLGLTSAKDGCAPQGQCGCCTVLVDGDARVACVTPVVRIAGRAVTTLEGLDPSVSEQLAEAFVITGGSQCGFCTPGIVMRAAAARAKGKTGRPDLDRALAAHLCRCTGWQTVYDALEHQGSEAERDLAGAARRAALEGASPQRVGPDVPLGAAGFADDTAPRDALVAVPLPPGSSSENVEAAGMAWVVGESLADARARAGKVQGRRTTVEAHPPLSLPELPEGGVRLATSWVEPAYLEPDASWCEPGDEPASSLANGGAFGGKVGSPVEAAARELARRYGRVVRTVFAREDVVRLGPKRPPISASAVLVGDRLVVRGRSIGPLPFPPPADARGGGPHRGPNGIELDVGWEVVAAQASGLRPAPSLRAAGLAELTVLVQGALEAAGHVTSEPLGDALHDHVVHVPSGAAAAVRVSIDAATGGIDHVGVTVAAGDPLDDVVLRSYSIGAAHMALGWVLTEGLAVDPETGDVHDLTIRSFGIIKPKDVPRIDVTIVDATGPPLAASSDAVFAAVAAATWNALARAEGERPEMFPALGTRASRMLRR